MRRWLLVAGVMACYAANFICILLMRSVLSRRPSAGQSCTDGLAYTFCLKLCPQYVRCESSSGHTAAPYGISKWI